MRGMGPNIPFNKRIANTLPLKIYKRSDKAYRTRITPIRTARIEIGKNNCIVTINIDKTFKCVAIEWRIKLMKTIPEILCDETSLNYLLIAF